MVTQRARCRNVHREAARVQVLVGSCLKCDEERKPLNGHAKVTGTKAFTCPVCPSPTAQETVDAKKVYDSEKRRCARAKRKKG